MQETDLPGYISTTPNGVPVSVPQDGGGHSDFGDILQLGAPRTGMAAGSVFDDRNANGIQDVSELGIAGASIDVLVPSSGTVLSSTLTGPSGAYQFHNLRAGSYLVRESDLPGYASSTPNLVSVSVVPDGLAHADFGDRLAASVGGVVFSDLNGDGVRAPGEPGIPGVPVDLLDPTSGALLSSTTSLADGSYVFAGIMARSYQVRESDPPGFGSTTPNLVAVSVAAGGAAAASFGDQQASTVAGSVYADLNGNGTRDPGEAGIAGVRIELFDPLSGLTLTTTTTGDGSYLFAGVRPGSDYVRETDPAGYQSTTPNMMPMSLVAGSAATASFGDQPAGTLSGTVYNDLNGNGIQDAQERGIGGVDIRLFEPLTSQLVTATTSANGAYLCTQVSPGAYQVREIDPTGFVSTTPDEVAVTLARGGAATANFGDQQRGTLSGGVFDDLDGSGSQDAGEVGIGGVLVQLRVAGSGAVITTAMTAGDGSYLFAAVPAGSYQVQEEDPAGFCSTTSNSVSVMVLAGGSGCASFGDQQTGTVSGILFNDFDGDGVRQRGEPGIGGVRVQLRDISTGDITTATTTGDGTYLFALVRPGTYQVRETDPFGYTSTTPNLVVVTVPAGGAASARFGDRPAAGILGVAAACPISCAGWSHTFVISYTSIALTTLDDVRLVVTVPDYALALPADSTSGLGPGPRPGTMMWRLGRVEPGERRERTLVLHLFSSIPNGTFLTVQITASSGDSLLASAGDTFEVRNDGTCRTIPVPTPAPTSTPTRRPTSSPTPTVSATPTATGTATPTATTQPSSTPTPGPVGTETATPSPTEEVTPVATVAPTPTGTPEAGGVRRYWLPWIPVAR